MDIGALAQEVERLSVLLAAYERGHMRTYTRLEMVDNPIRMSGFETQEDIDKHTRLIRLLATARRTLAAATTEHDAAEREAAKERDAVDAVHSAQRAIVQAELDVIAQDPMLKLEHAENAYKHTLGREPAHDWTRMPQWMELDAFIALHPHEDVSPAFALHKLAKSCAMRVSKNDAQICTAQMAHVYVGGADDPGNRFMAACVWLALPPWLRAFSGIATNNNADTSADFFFDVGYTRNEADKLFALVLAFLRAGGRDVCPDPLTELTIGTYMAYEYVYHVPPAEESQRIKNIATLVGGYSFIFKDAEQDFAVDKINNACGTHKIHRGYYPLVVRRETLFGTSPNVGLTPAVRQAIEGGTYKEETWTRLWECVSPDALTPDARVSSALIVACLGEHTHEVVSICKLVRAYNAYKPTRKMQNALDRHALVDEILDEMLRAHIPQHSLDASFSQYWGLRCGRVAYATKLRTPTGNTLACATLILDRILATPMGDVFAPYEENSTSKNMLGDLITSTALVLAQTKTADEAQGAVNALYDLQQMNITARAQDEGLRIANDPRIRLLVMMLHLDDPHMYVRTVQQIRNTRTGCPVITDVVVTAANIYWARVQLLLRKAAPTCPDAVHMRELLEENADCDYEQTLYMGTAVVLHTCIARQLCAPGSALAQLHDDSCAFIIGANTIMDVNGKGAPTGTSFADHVLKICADFVARANHSVPLFNGFDLKTTLRVVDYASDDTTLITSHEIVHTLFGAAQYPRQREDAHDAYISEDQRTERSALLVIAHELVRDYKRRVLCPYLVHAAKEMDAAPDVLLNAHIDQMDRLENHVANLKGACVTTTLGRLEQYKSRYVKLQKIHPLLYKLSALKYASDTPVYASAHPLLWATTPPVARVMVMAILHRDGYDTHTIVNTQFVGLVMHVALRMYMRMYNVKWNNQHEIDVFTHTMNTLSDTGVMRASVRIPRIPDFVPTGPALTPNVVPSGGVDMWAKKAIVLAHVYEEYAHMGLYAFQDGGLTRGAYPASEQRAGPTRGYDAPHPSMMENAVGTALFWAHQCIGAIAMGTAHTFYKRFAWVTDEESVTKTKYNETAQELNLRRHMLSLQAQSGDMWTTHPNARVMVERMAEMCAKIHTGNKRAFSLQNIAAVLWSVAQSPSPRMVGTAMAASVRAFAIVLGPLVGYMEKDSTMNYAETIQRLSVQTDKGIVVHSAPPLLEVTPSVQTGKRQAALRDVFMPFWSANTPRTGTLTLPEMFMRTSNDEAALRSISGSRGRTGMSGTRATIPYVPVADMLAEWIPTPHAQALDFDAASALDGRAFAFYERLSNISTGKKIQAAPTRPHGYIIFRETRILPLTGIPYVMEGLSAQDACEIAAMLALGTSTRAPISFWPNLTTAIALTLDTILSIDALLVPRVPSLTFPRMTLLGGNILNYAAPVLHAHNEERHVPRLTRAPYITGRYVQEYLQGIAQTVGQSVYGSNDASASVELERVKRLFGAIKEWMGGGDTRDMVRHAWHASEDWALYRHDAPSALTDYSADTFVAIPDVYVLAVEHQNDTVESKGGWTQRQNEAVNAALLNSTPAALCVHLAVRALMVSPKATANVTNAMFHKDAGVTRKDMGNPYTRMARLIGTHPELDKALDEIAKVTLRGPLGVCRNLLVMALHLLNVERRILKTIAESDGAKELQEGYPPVVYAPDQPQMTPVSYIGTMTVSYEEVPGVPSGSTHMRVPIQSYIATSVLTLLAPR